MYYKHAPKTCRNFLELSRRGYYDNVIFHRIIKVSAHSLLAALLNRSINQSGQVFFTAFIFLRFRISSCKVGILLAPEEAANPSTGQHISCFPPLSICKIALQL
jgi:hypothetical protein